MLCSAVGVGWLFGVKLNNVATAGGENIFVVLLMSVAFVGVAIACWTSLPQVVAIAEARAAAEHLFTVAQDGILVVDLLANAIDALEESLVISHLSFATDKRQIRIHTQLTNQKQVVIRIDDNGLGIPEDLQKRLFEPFFTTKLIGKGTGLGLSISYQIITQKHRGKLQCISAPGQGTEFVIVIPLNQQAI